MFHPASGTGVRGQLPNLRCRGSEDIFECPQKPILTWAIALRLGLVHADGTAHEVGLVQLGDGIVAARRIHGHEAKPAAAPGLTVVGHKGIRHLCACVKMCVCACLPSAPSERAGERRAREGERDQEGSRVQCKRGPLTLSPTTDTHTHKHTQEQEVYHVHQAAQTHTPGRTC